MVFVSQDQVTFYLLLNKLETSGFVSLLLYSQAVPPRTILVGSI